MDGGSHERPRGDQHRLGIHQQGLEVRHDNVLEELVVAIRTGEKKPDLEGTALSESHDVTIGVSHEDLFSADRLPREGCGVCSSRSIDRLDYTWLDDRPREVRHRHDNIIEVWVRIYIRICLLYTSDAADE